MDWVTIIIIIIAAGGLKGVFDTITSANNAFSGLLGAIEKLRAFIQTIKSKTPITTPTTAKKTTIPSIRQRISRWSPWVSLAFWNICLVYSAIGLNLSILLINKLERSFWKWVDDFLTLITELIDYVRVVDEGAHIRDK